MLLLMSMVRIDDPAGMNVLGLFLARALRENLAKRGLPCRLRGALTVDADGMKATVRFGPDEVVVLRGEVEPRVVVRASLARLVDAIVRPGLRRFLRIGWNGNPFFALRAMRYLAP
jgi:hypothetical protein